MNIVAGSDIHGLLVNPNDMPQGDVLILCGDIVPLKMQKSYSKSVAWFNEMFVPWTNSLKYDKIIFIGGNHDFFLQMLHYYNNDWKNANDVMNELLYDDYKNNNKLIYLFRNSIEYNSVKFYGTPFISNLTNWAFYLPDDELKKEFNNIEDCDVLITHQPPKVGDIGRVLEPTWDYLKNFGNEDLYNAIKNKNIKWSLSGHVHSGAHEVFNDSNTNFVNVSILNEAYENRYKFFQFFV